MLSTVMAVCQLQHNAVVRPTAHVTLTKFPELYVAMGKCLTVCKFPII